MPVGNDALMCAEHPHNGANFFDQINILKSFIRLRRPELADLFDMDMRTLRTLVDANFRMS
jgi:hypothetical protein